MSSTEPGQPTSPLRIPKRNNAAALARRSSSSYKHVRNNNLVSNSPFKSIIPTPSHRRVSGEKRPRPLSLAEQADTERTFAYKRERRQSKGFQGLIQNEPVTKSPFRRPPNVDQPPNPPLSANQLATALIFSAPPPVQAPAQSQSHFSESSPPPVHPDASHPAPHLNTSPARSSLVSRRMHGPRASGSGRDSLGSRRQRRKTVTFHEECDVVEFEPDEESDTSCEQQD